jgi:hypothetical protein
MTTSNTQQSTLFRLPREIRDCISILAFQGFGPFPNYEKINASEKCAIFHELPGLCRVNRQMFRETTPLFLRNRISITTQDAHTSQQLLDLYSHFSGEEATKGTEELTIRNWSESSTAVHLDLVLKLSNLDSINIVYAFANVNDGVPLSEFNYTYEQELWLDTGLHYAPLDGRSIEEEKRILSNDVQIFIAKFRLDDVLTLPMLKSLQFRFYAKSLASRAYTVGDEGIVKKKSGYYRHRLCNPLWRWATQRMLEKWGDGDNNEEIEKRYVWTCLPEYYERVNVGFGWRPDGV